METRYTLHDLRRDRAQYEAEMACYDELDWARRRDYFAALRKFRMEGGQLEAAHNIKSGSMSRTEQEA